MLDEDLCILASKSNLLMITELRPWMSKIKELDTCCQIELKQMARFFNVASTHVMFLYYTVLTIWTIIGTVILTLSSSPPCTDFTHTCLLILLHT
jgi:hypothetical protein